MSRERNEEKKGLSPTQRKACVVLALCALAVVMSILAAWVLPTKLGLFAGGKDSYDPDAYPLDTTLDSILPQSAADDAYITASVFAGDQYAVTLQKDTRITLNQFVGQEGLQISKALSTSCVNFASDASSYTIPQAIPKMKARRVFVMLGANDVDGSVSVDSFIADYKQFLQSIRSAYAYCDIIAVGIPPVTEDSTNAAETQTRIDQFNQAIAAASSDLGFKYLNTAEALKNTRGYGEGTYFESNGFSTSGARALLEYAKSRMAKVPFDQADILFVDETGKDISGAGMDPNVTGRSAQNGISRPFAERIVARDLTDEAHHNATGMGNADVTTRRLFDKIDMEQTYPNSLTSRDINGFRIPIVMENDDLAIRFALHTITGANAESGYRAMWIRDTNHVQTFYVTERLLADTAAMPWLRTDGVALRPVFGADGYFTGWERA